MAISKGALCARWAARLLFLAAAAMFVHAATSHVALPPLHPVREYGFFDLRVYRHAAGVVSSGQPLYAVKLRRGLGFTYPPFAVLLFLPLTLISVRESELVVTLLNVALVAVAVHAALALARRLAGPERSDAVGDRRRRRGGWWSAARSLATWLATGGSAWGWLAAAAALWFEPVTSAIGYGQIDLLIAALAIADLAYGRHRHVGGVGVGLAAALKLTPLVFIPYLALTGRSRMAARAVVAVGFSIALALAVLPSDSLKYWGGKFLDVSRVAGHGRLSGAGVADQSLRGGLLRLLPGIQHMGPTWMLAALLVGAVALVLAVRAGRRGDEVWGYLLAAIAGLLMSPVSWTHHWAIVVPGVLALVVSNRRRAVAGLLSSATALAFADEGYKLWPLIRHKPPLIHFSGSGQLLANLYVFGGLAAIGIAAALDLRLTLAHRLRARRPAAPAAPAAPALPAATGSWEPAPTRARFAPPDPGHPGAALRAMTTSQQLAPDRKSVR